MDSTKGHADASQAPENPNIVAPRTYSDDINKCDPEHLDIAVFNDRQCQKRNADLTKKSQLTKKQKEKFTSCQMLAHGQKIYGKVQCRDNGFIINIYTDKDCMNHATKSGKPMRTPIYYGRCHKEGQGVYFTVNKMSPKMNIEEDKEESKTNNTSSNATNASNHTGNATNGTLNASKDAAGKSTPSSAATVGDQDDSSLSDQMASLPVCKPGQKSGACRPAGETLESSSIFDDPKENVTVNSVSNRPSKDEKPPPPPPKYDDGYSHAQPEHIKVSTNSGSYQEAVKDFYVDEAQKEKDRKAKSKAKREAYIKAEQEKKEAEEK